MGEASPRVLVLGGSGVIGAELCRQFERLPGAVRLTAVSRRGRGRTIGMDVTDRAALAPLVAGSDVVVNAVASTRWTMLADEALAANVMPLRALLEVAPARVRVVHLSTSYADGLRPEDGPFGYRNRYEWSKATAETVLRRERPDAHMLRFPLVIGRAGDGVIQRFVGLYTILQALTAGLLPAVIGCGRTPVELVPVDMVAGAIRRVATGELDAPVGSDGTGHTLGAGPNAPRVDELLDRMVDQLNRWRASRRLPPVDRPPVIDSEAWRRFHRPFLWPHIGRVQRRAIELLEEFAPYLSDPLASTPDQECPGVRGALERSVWYWADTSPRQAARLPRPWASSDTRIWA